MLNSGLQRIVNLLVNLANKAAAASGIERSSIEDYIRTLRIVPFVGALKLNALTAPRLRTYEDQIRDEGRSAFTIRRTKTTLGTPLADA